MRSILFLSLLPRLMIFMPRHVLLAMSFFSIEMLLHFPQAMFHGLHVFCLITLPACHTKIHVSRYIFFCPPSALRFFFFFFFRHFPPSSCPDSGSTSPPRYRRHFADIVIIATRLSAFFNFLHTYMII